MPLSYQDRHFKTADQVKLNSKQLSCKICGKKMKGKSTLSRHISHAHSNIPIAKREKMVIDAYFGQAKVDDTIKKYKNRTYNLSTLPIDISRYISLAQIEQDDLDSSDRTNQEEFKKVEKKKIEVKPNYPIVKVVDDFKKDAPVYFVEDIFYDYGDGKLKLRLTQSLDEALPIVLLREFLNKLKLKNSNIYIEFDNELISPKKIDTIPDEEVGEDRVQSTVTFSGKSESK